MESLRMLSHGLPRQRNGREVLPQDRVPAASPVEAGGTAESDSRQGLRTSETTVTRRDRQGRRTPGGTPHGKPGQANGGRGCGRGQGTQPRRQTTTWCFPAIGRNRELVWLRATRSQHVGVTRITHQAAIRLGLPESVIEAYQVRLKLSGEPRFTLSTEGVETLECVRPRNERNDERVLQPDVIISWADWNKVQPFAMSGWAIPGQALPGATAPATKWHLRMNLRGNPPVYLNVQLDPMRKRTTITHEAAVRIGESFFSFYMLFARTEAGEVGSLVVAGADAIVRADRRRPVDLTEKGTGHPAGRERHSQHGQVPQGRVEERARDWRQRWMPCQRTVAWKAEGVGGHQGPRLDMHGVREDRQVREGHRHEGDVRHDQRAVNHPALSRCEARTEGERRAGMAGPSR